METPQEGISTMWRKERVEWDAVSLVLGQLSNSLMPTYFQLSDQIERSLKCIRHLSMKTGTTPEGALHRVKFRYQ